jgi:hypothetical protein
MRSSLISKRMTSTATLRRCSTTASITVPPAMPIPIASPPSPQTLEPRPEGARYLGTSVDRHVHKVAEAVDDGRLAAGGLWTPPAAVPGQAGHEDLWRTRRHVEELPAE